MTASNWRELATRAAWGICVFAALATTAASPAAADKIVVSNWDGYMPKDIADARMKAIDEAGWESVHFAWAGADKPGVGHQYYVQGPTFLIELNNTQTDASGNRANHIHSVWRDMRGDFGIPRGATAAASASK